MEIRCRKRKYLLKEFCDYVAYTILLFFFFLLFICSRGFCRITRHTDTKLNRNEHTAAKKIIQLISMRNIVYATRIKYWLMKKKRLLALPSATRNVRCFVLFALFVWCMSDERTQLSSKLYYRDWCRNNIQKGYQTRSGTVIFVQICFCR